MSQNAVLPDSQVSGLFGQDIYDDIEKEIGPMNVSLFSDDEDSKYIGPLINPLINPHMIEPVPVKDEFPGQFNFDFSIPNMQGKHWVFSALLNKVFINMDQTLPLQFTWNHAIYMEPFFPNLYIRTAMVFSLDQYRNDPVQRCHNHMVPTNNNNIRADPNSLKHVVRSEDIGSTYIENNGHLSVITPCRTPQAGSQYVQMFLKFLCKNSCTSGMNRRPTELIFTLEDSRCNEVLGRRRLAIRVCSCPKRDKEKEESENSNVKPTNRKRKLNALPPPGKKIMPMQHHDNQIYNVQFNVVGREMYQAVLKSAYNTILGESSRNGQYGCQKPYLDELLDQIL